MKYYWPLDFEENDAVKEELESWLSELSVYDKLDVHNKECKWVAALYAALKKEYIRLRSISWEKEKKETERDLLSYFEDIDVSDSSKMMRILTNLDARNLADQITLLDDQLYL